MTDAEWAIITPLLPGAGGKKNGRPRPDDRKVLNGIFFILRSGAPWRDLPERYGPYTTVYNRFNRNQAQLCPGGVCEYQPAPGAGGNLVQGLIVVAFLAVVSVAARSTA